MPACPLVAFFRKYTAYRHGQFLECRGAGGFIAATRLPPGSAYSSIIYRSEAQKENRCRIGSVGQPVGLGMHLRGRVLRRRKGRAFRKKNNDLGFTDETTRGELNSRKESTEKMKRIAQLDETNTEKSFFFIIMGTGDEIATDLYRS